MEFSFRRRQLLNGRDPPVCDLADLADAGPRRATVDMYGAGAAESATSAELGADKAQTVAKNPE